MFRHWRFLVFCKGATFRYRNCSIINAIITLLVYNLRNEYDAVNPGITIGWMWGDVECVEHIREFDFLVLDTFWLIARDWKRHKCIEPVSIQWFNHSGFDFQVVSRTFSSSYMFPCLRKSEKYFRTRTRLEHDGCGQIVWWKILFWGQNVHLCCKIREHQLKCIESSFLSLMWWFTLTLQWFLSNSNLVYSLMHKICSVIYCNTKF